VSILVASQPSITRTTSRRLRRTSRSEAWNSHQRNVLGRAFFQGPLRQSSRNRQTRSLDRRTTNSHAGLAAKLVNGIEVRPESLSRWMWFSTFA